MQNFPVFLSVADKSIVVFGGGADAAAKLRLVQKTQARIFVVAPCLDDQVLVLGQAFWVKQDPMDFELPDNTALVYAATGDSALDAQLAKHARMQGVLACAVDQMEHSDFATPAIVDRDPVVVAIGTEGTSPVLARGIKADIEARLEPGLGKIARAADSLRSLVAKRLVPGKPRRQFWHNFLAQARKSPDQAAQLGQRLLEGEYEPKPRLDLVDVRVAEPDLLTRRAHAALHDADVVVADANVSPAFFELARREAIRLCDDAGGQARVAQALRAGQHVIIFRQEGGWADLTELAIGFGITAQLHVVARPEGLVQATPRLVPKVAA